MKNLKIYFTSDVHGYVFPTDYRDRTQKPLGFLNIMKEYDKDGNTLIIDGGDTIQGSPFTTYLSNQKFDIHPIAEVMNKAGYDYITLGNHDFNYGYDYLKKYTDHLNAKCLCTNIIERSGNIDILPYDIKKMDNGLTVGIIGCTTDFITTWERAEHITNFEITDTMESIRKFYSKLRAEVDILIGIYHGGFEYDLSSHKKLSDTSENIAYTLCQNFDFDILLTGHQHMEIEGEWLHGTYIVQTPEHGRKYIDMNVFFEDNKITQVTSELRTPKTNPHQDMYNHMLSIECSVQKWLDRPVGFLDINLQPKDHLSMALEGSYLANFINQVQLDVSGADISCTSFGNSIKGFSKEVTVRDIVSTYVYPNTLVVLKVTGKDIISALERCASYFDTHDGDIRISDSFLKPKLAHYNYDYFSNIYYTFDLTKKVGNRVIDVKFKGNQIAEDQTYTLVMNNYRSTGVGGYEFYQQTKISKEILIEIPELIINYLQKQQHVIVDKNQYISKSSSTVNY